MIKILIFIVKFDSNQICKHVRSIWTLTCCRILSNYVFMQSNYLQNHRISEYDLE